MDGLTVRETAKRLGVSKERVNAMRRQGRWFKADGFPLRIPTRQVERYIAALREDTSYDAGEWCTVEDAKEIAGVTQQSIARWVKVGAVETRRPRWRYLVKKDDVEAIASARRAKLEF